MREVGVETAGIGVVQGTNGRLPIIANAGHISRNLAVPALVEQALARGEGILTSRGAFACTTGKYTGRSPRDKFIVDEPEAHDRVAWNDNNRPFQPERFTRLHQRLMAYLQGRELFVFDGFAGADPRYRLPIRVINEFAWHNLFARQLFVRPSPEELAAHRPEFTVICAPGFLADPDTDGTNSEAFIIVSFARRVIVIGGTRYAGEIKKAVFSVLNYLLPERGVLPMHCSANIGADGDVALYFGLSGTGKTTLSSIASRRFIGDDEHGWAETGIFNFEAGCYAKTIRLSAEGEPLIWNAIRFGAVLENVPVDPQSRAADWVSESLTENTRAAYPVEHIPGAVTPGLAGHPRTICFLTADASGVLPPIARLTRDQALYHFLSGYTSKLAGTERGIAGATATFSALFGAPFFPLPARVYAGLLGERLDRYGTQVYLVNTGWSGGPPGVGRRVPLAYTRAMVAAAVDGQLVDEPVTAHPIFGVLMPRHCPGVPESLLDPRSTWADQAAYDRESLALARRFRANYAQLDGAPTELEAAGPRADT